MGGPGQWAGGDKGGEGAVEGTQPRPGGHHIHGGDLGVKSGEKLLFTFSIIKSK